ncbi:MAG: PQQ-binding-like beta-propeller repeat protein [Halobacteriota archaeon]
MIEPICIGFFTVVVSSPISTHQLCASHNCVRITNIYYEHRGGADQSPTFLYRLSREPLTGAVYAIDARNGQKLLNFTTEGQVWSSPAVVDDVVHIGSEDRNVYALNARTGD